MIDIERRLAINFIKLSVIQSEIEANFNWTLVTSQINLLSFFRFWSNIYSNLLAQSAGAEEYADCFSAEGLDPHPPLSRASFTILIFFAFKLRI